MGIGTRLTLIITILVLSIGLVGINATNDADKTFSTLINDVVATDNALRDLQSNTILYVTAVSELGLLYQTDAPAENITDIEAEITETSQAMDQHVQEYHDLIALYSPSELDSADQLQTTVSNLQEVGGQFTDAIRHRVSNAELLAIRDTFEINEGIFNDQIESLINVETSDIATLDAQLQTNLHNATIFGISLTIICILAAIGAAVVMARSIIVPVQQLQKGATQIAQGNYQQTVNISSSDEIGQLAGAFNQMSQTILKRDIELKQAAQDLEKQVIEAQTAREQAERSDQVKSAFLASMSHELRTPLNSVINYTKFVIKGVMGPVNEKQVETLTKVADSGKHLLNLINDVLDISKIESGSLSLFVEDNVDLAEIMRAMQSTAESLLNEKGVKVEVDIPNPLPLMTGDKQRIRQIMLNIVSNACKFTTEGHIKLSAHEQGDEILISIEDTGPGIRAEDRIAVFEPFKQTETGLRQGQGTGLGMPISKSLAEAHGGRLWFKSSPGNGTTFYVALPTKSEQLVPVVG